MKSLLDTYKENVGQRALFSEFIDIDFYDGSTEAVCRLVDSDQWLICSLVYFDIKGRKRIFSLLMIDSQVLLKFKSILEEPSNDKLAFYEKLKAQVKIVHNGYSGKVFLFKGDSLFDAKYEVVEIPLKRLQYFKDIEEVLEQSEEAKLKWISFFQS